MRAYIDCVHCYLKQAVSCMAAAGVDEDTQHEILYELMDFVKTFDRNDTPANNSTEVLLKVYERIGIADPYKDLKKHSNDLALKLYPKLKKILASSKDRLYDALKISVAGNVIDLGINRDFDIDESLKYSLEVGFSINDYDKFLNKLQKVNNVLFLGDNAGEIVFDKVLVEELVDMGKEVIYTVKAGPILNDATIEDAVYVGMDNVARVITTGSNYLGTSLNKISKEFEAILHSSNLVISKGQANFESLEQEDTVKEKVYFLLKIKCEGVGKTAGSKFGDVVFFTPNK
ncbi:damage-control phosphatase ARMT1 family protein [Desulfolucanica intricata]|uniref:damage-control phosphatase ARMT1 family protein n=1 Tax=Desulfolucanica intricata TaxID=1285191 RepID=UPI000830897D|nr:ARMT1-like domain-containing protein [Desulfolucanica intricata]